MKKVCIVLATVLVAMAVAVVAAISLMFWATMLALVSALLCLIIPLREGRSAEGEDRQQ